MKITGIAIGEYRQFKNIKFDFTYPANHHNKEKAGKPLDKVCFIGQSGTGKTTLLNIIWELLSTLDIITDVYDTNRTEVRSYSNTFLSEIIHASSYSMSIGGQIVKFDRISDIAQSDLDFLNHWFTVNLTKTEQYKLIDTSKIGLFIKDSIIRDADAFLIDQNLPPSSVDDFIKSETQVEDYKIKREDLIRKIGKKRIIELGDGRSLSIWQYILRDILQYDETGIELIQNIAKSKTSSVQKLLEQLEYWRKNTTNPRLNLAEQCLNPLLNHFYLEMDIESDVVPIVIKTKQGIKIDSKILSTGARQLMATAIPIYKFDTTDTVILFDEPERSLFPDIQRILIDYYISLAPEAQFFVATHSPIIASAFEPCERFVLYFDENGEVNFRNGTAPEGDDPNDILSEDFGMEELMLPKGLKEYERYRELGTKIRGENDPKRKDELIVERAKLGDLYRF